MEGEILRVGNESWGCGGSMRPEYYADLYRRYSTYCRNYDGNRLFKIASGASDYDYNWTEVLMKNVGHRMDGLSLHYYTVLGWSGSKVLLRNSTMRITIGQWENAAKLKMCSSVTLPLWTNMTRRSRLA